MKEKQKTENRKQKTENRKQKTENRKQKTDRLIIIHSTTDVFYTPKGRLHYFIEEFAKKGYTIGVFYYRNPINTKEFFGVNYFNDLGYVYGYCINQIRDSFENPEYSLGTASASENPSYSPINKKEFNAFFGLPNWVREKVDELLSYSSPENTIYFNYNGLIFGSSLRKYIKSKDIKTIFDVTEILPNNKYGFFSKYAFKKNIKRSDIVTVPTKNITQNYFPVKNYQNFMSGEMMGYNPLGEKVVEIATGIDIHELDGYKKNKKIDQKYKDLQKFISGGFGLYIGTLDPSLVDIETVLEVYTKAHRQLLIIANDNIERIQNLIKDFHVSNKVKVLTNISNDEVGYFIEKSDYGLLPFKINKISNTYYPIELLKYFHFGKMVFSTKTETIQDIIMQNGLVEYYDEISDLLNLIHHYEIDKDKNKRNRIKIVNNHNIPNMIKGFEEILYGED